MTETFSGTPLPVPEGRDAGGWPLYEVKAEGFALSLPPDWRQFDMNSATFEAGLRDAIERNPELGAMQGNLRQQMVAGIKFFGLHEPSMGTGFATNVNVLRLPLPPGGTLDTAVADSLRQLDGAASVAKPIVHVRLKAGAENRERLHYTMAVNTPAGQSSTLALTQYVLVRGGEGYVVTLTTLPAREAEYAPDFEKIGQSFRFLQK